MRRRDGWTRCMHDAALRDLAARGLDRPAIAAATGMSPSGITGALARLGLVVPPRPNDRPGDRFATPRELARRAARAVRRAAICARVAAGESRAEVAASLGVSASRVGQIVRRGAR